MLDQSANPDLLLMSLRDHDGFDRLVDVRGPKGNVTGQQPARGDGPITIVAFTHHVYYQGRHGGDDRVFYAWLSVTHAATGTFVGEHQHPLASVERRWLIPATPLGIALAEDLRARYLALDVPWNDFPESLSDRLAFKPAVESVRLDDKRAVKVERDAARRFRAALRERQWYLGKTDHERRVREIVNNRFFWTRSRSTASSRQDC
jgi:hypothetical protein